MRQWKGRKRAKEGCLEEDREKRKKKGKEREKKRNPKPTRSHRFFSKIKISKIVAI